MNNRISRRSLLQGTGYALGSIGLFAATGTTPAILATDSEPLSLWTDSSIRSTLLDFVTATTTDGSPDFIDPVDRIAVFDNDGTLWCEQPYYTQIAFALAQLETGLAQHPELATQEPFVSILAGDIDSALGQSDRTALDLMVTNTEPTTTGQYIAQVAAWLETATHPQLDRRYTDLVFTPMVQLLGYLRDHGFQNWIVSGGGQDFIRAFAEPVYGIPLDRILGSTVETEFSIVDGEPDIVRSGTIAFVCDGPGKPVGIARTIGRRPVLAFGNSDGDYEMLQYTTSGDGPRLGLLLHHDDAEREFAYDRNSLSGQLSRGLDDANTNGWHIVSMKTDFVEVFAPR